MANKSAGQAIRERMDAAKKGMEADLDTLERIGKEAGGASGEAGKHLKEARDRQEKSPTAEAAGEVKLWEHVVSGLYAAEQLGKKMRESYKETMR